MNKLNKIILKSKKLLLWIFFLFFPSFIFSGSWKMETSWPTSPAGTELTPDATIAELVAYIYEWGATIGVLIFFAVLVFSGFKYVTSAGSPDKMSKAKKGIISSFSGVAILLSSFLLLNIINPELTQIESLIPESLTVGSQEFQTGASSGDSLCEFAFVTTQEDETLTREKIYFMIPGMQIDTDNVFPVEGQACIPEKEEAKIMEVRENDTGKYMVLVTRKDGAEVLHEEEDEEHRVYRYQKNGENVLVDRKNQNFKNEIKEWCDDICNNADCGGIYNFCDYNIATNINDGELEVVDYIDSLKDSSYYNYFDAYLSESSSSLFRALNNPNQGSSQIQDIVLNDIINGVYDINNDYRKQLNDLNSKRYEEITYDEEDDEINHYIVKREEVIFDFLMRSKERKTYNIFEDCETMITHPDFVRPRCLQLEEDGDELKIREWRRIGYASLTKAWEAIGNKNQLKTISVCPSAEMIAIHNEDIDQDDSLLGYKRDSSGGGCSIAFYDGETRYWSWSGRILPTCTNKISQPSADMNFDGLVDRESKCMELIGHEPDTPRIIHEVDFDRRNVITNKIYGYIYMCEGFLKSREERQECRNSFDRNCREDCEIKEEIKVHDGKYTVLIRNNPSDASLVFEDSDSCQVLGDLNEDTKQTDCLIDIKEDVSFVIKQDEKGLSDEIKLFERSIHVDASSTWTVRRANVHYRFSYTKERWEYLQLNINRFNPEHPGWEDVEKIGGAFTSAQQEIGATLENKNYHDGVDFLLDEAENISGVDEVKIKKSSDSLDAAWVNLRYNHNSSEWESEDSTSSWASVEKHSDPAEFYPLINYTNRRLIHKNHPTGLDFIDYMKSRIFILDPYNQ